MGVLRRWAVVLVLLAAACACAQPPASLVFGDPAPVRRLLLSPAPAARSGGWQLEVVQVDHFAADQRGGARCRILAALTAEQGALPTPLEVLDTPFAVARDGGLVAISDWRLARGAGSDTAWLAIYLSSPAAGLSGLAITLGQSGPMARRLLPLPLEPLGAPRLLEGLDLAVEPTLTRREGVVLDTNPDGPPYFFALESTRRAAPPPSAADSSYFSLRLHTLGADPLPSGWELSDLLVRGDGGPTLDDWRFVRRPWRPDWGGWLGVTGSDCAALGGRPAGVALDVVDVGGPGALGGLRLGDVIVASNGQPCPDAYTLGRVVRRQGPGAKLDLTLWRGGKPMAVRLTLGRAPLWPDLDDGEFEAVWSRLATVRGGERREDVMNAWDWQARQPVPPGFEPESVELVFTRREPSSGLTFLLRGIPLQP